MGYACFYEWNELNGSDFLIAYDIKIFFVFLLNSIKHMSLCIFALYESNLKTSFSTPIVTKNNVKTT